MIKNLLATSLILETITQGITKAKYILGAQFLPVAEYTQDSDNYRALEQWVIENATPLNTKTFTKGDSFVPRAGVYRAKYKNVHLLVERSIRSITDIEAERIYTITFLTRNPKILTKFNSYINSLTKEVPVIPVSNSLCSED